VSVIGPLVWAASWVGLGRVAPSQTKQRERTPPCQTERHNLDTHTHTHTHSSSLAAQNILGRVVTLNLL
jgi:hypothetical protein